MRQIVHNTSILRLALVATVLTAATAASAQDDLVTLNPNGANTIYYFFGMFGEHSDGVSAERLIERYPTHYSTTPSWWNNQLYFAWSEEPANGDDMFLNWNTWKDEDELAEGESNPNPAFSKIWTRKQAVGFKLKANMRCEISVQYAAAPYDGSHVNGGKIVVVKGDTYSTSLPVIAETPSTVWDDGNIFKNGYSYQSKGGTISFVTANTDQVYWLTGDSDYPGAQITGFTVKYVSELDDTLPSDMVTISDNYLWYSPGSNISVYQKRGNSTNGYLWFRYLPAVAGSGMVYVNGTSQGTTRMGDSQAMGFRLAANKTYRIQVFSDADASALSTTLKKGTNFSTATYVNSNCYSQNIMTASGGQTTTRLFTYELTTGSGEETFWIAPQTECNVGALEINVNGYDANKDLSSDTKLNQLFPEGKTVIVFNEHGADRVYEAESNGNNVRSLKNAKWLKSNHNGSDCYAYNNGPNLPFNTLQLAYGDGTSLKPTVMINNGTKIGLRKIKKGTKIVIPFVSDSGVGLELWGGDTFGSATKLTDAIASQDGSHTLTYTYTGDNDTYLWLTSNNTTFSYVSGLTVSVPKTINTTAINGDFIWYSDENQSLPFYNTFEDGYLFHNGDEHQPSTETMKVDGRTMNVYDTTVDNDLIAFRIANDLQGEIRVYYKAYTVADNAITYDSNVAPALKQGNSFDNATTGVGTTKNSYENTSVGKDYISYPFSSGGPRFYTVSGGKIAAIEVFVYQTPLNTTQDVINGPTESWVGAGAYGYNVTNGLINDCDAEVVGANEVLHSYGKFTGNDVALNSYMLNGHHSIIVDENHTVSYKFAPGHKYRIKAWSYPIKIPDENNVVGQDGYLAASKTTVGALSIDGNPQKGNGEVYNGTLYNTGANGYRLFEYDLTMVSENGELTFGGGSHAYFVGIEVTTLEPQVEFDTDVPGIFTGLHKGKLLVYCTDNGTLENFMVPKAYKNNGGTRGDEITNNNSNYTLELLQTYDYAGGTVNNGTGVSISSGQVNGIKDTDRDMLFRVTYSYDHEGTTISDYYYLWYANYLKIGWWTCRDAKLIVGTDKSSSDKNNIIVGEFYISSGSEGTLYFEYIDKYLNPQNDHDAYAEGTTTGTETVEYTYTTETNSNRTVTKQIYQNDHQNHTGDAITLPYPGRDNVRAYWGTAEDVDVARTLRLTLPRHTGSGATALEWPSFTVKLTFHYVPAPEITELAADANGNNVNVTTYNGNHFTPQTPAEGKFYYTLDGTRPRPTSLVKTTSGSATTLTNKNSATYYAAERVTVAKDFYINNPYTTHIEDMTQYELMTESSNRTKNFYAISAVHYSTVDDPNVAYVAMNDGRIEQKDGSTVTNTSFTVTGPGGKVWDYPVGSDNPMMHVMMGTNTIKVYRNGDNGNAFYNSGVTWSLRGTETQPFAEHLDNQQYANNHTDVLEGANYSGQNADPYTECNGAYGAANTEAGGKWLTPVGGDFIRFEPEYDGIVTVWIRQNGAAQGKEYNGDLTRRPVYVMDENGKIMPRSNIKPSSENYYAIDGVYAEIDEVNSKLRQDFRIAWKAGLINWRSGFKGNETGIADNKKAMFRLFNYWYGLPLYQNTDDAIRNGTEITNNTGAFDIADSWISRSARVQSVICDNNPIIYRSNHLYDIEATLKFHKTDGSLTDVRSNLSCAKYGWEVPCYNIVRYRFPVKAGKSYYIAGRGTKNMFVATKFDPMPANYNCGMYQSAGDNYNINENSYSATIVTDQGWNNKKLTTPRETIVSNYSSLPTYHLYSEETNTNTNDALMDVTVINNEGSIYGTTCNVQLHRKFEAGKWYGIVLPFSVSESKMREIFGDTVKVLYIDPYDHVILNKGDKSSNIKYAATPGVYDQKLRFTYHKYQMLYANTPAFICPAQTIENPLMKHVTIDYTNLVDDDYDNIGYKVGEINGYEFYVTGSYKMKAKGEIGEMYYIDNFIDLNKVNTGIATVYHSMAGIAMKAGRAYITVKAPSSGQSGQTAPRLNTVGTGTFDSEAFDAESTGIIDIVADDAASDLFINDENVYDLMGRVVGYGSTNGLNSGIYIYKGRKVYIR